MTDSFDLYDINQKIQQAKCAIHHHLEAVRQAQQWLRDLEGRKELLQRDFRKKRLKLIEGDKDD